MLSDALDVLGLAAFVVTTYVGFGTVPAGYALGVALFVAGLIVGSGRPDVALPRVRIPIRKVKRASVDVPLTNGKVDAELAKRG